MAFQITHVTSSMDGKTDNVKIHYARTFGGVQEFTKNINNDTAFDTVSIHIHYVAVDVYGLGGRSYDYA